MFLNKKLIAILLVFVGLTFQSCSNETTSDPDQTARVKVKLVDFPGDYLEVNVHVVDVMYNISNDDEDTENGWQSFDSFEETQIIDLTELTAGNNLLLADELLPAGYLNQIRLVLSDGNTILVDVDGTPTSYPLATPSAQQSGLKIKVDTELEGGFSYTIILDWDVQKSIVKKGNGEYQLKPVIRAELDKNSGGIEGFVFGDLIDDTIEEAVALENVVVELYSANNLAEVFTTTTTDAEGYFLFEGLPTISYTIKINRDGFNPYNHNSEIPVNSGVISTVETITLEPVE